MFAHTPNENGDWHPLADHLRAVADAAASNAEPFGGANLARIAGLLHDAGKASEAFQRYLERCAANPGKRFPTVDHKGAGAVRAAEVFEPLAGIVLGHHGGLSDLGEVKDKWKEFGSRRAELAATLVRFDRLGLPQPVEAEPPLWLDSDELGAELFFRLVFSALVDADHADTERHFNPEVAAHRRGAPSVNELWEPFTEHHRALTEHALDTPVNRVRREVFDACLATAEQPPGWFRLTVPTGGGKTLSGLAFALRHALLHGQRRVIFAVPYLTITDQTVGVYRRVVPIEHALLEHTSSAGRKESREGEATLEELWRRLASQDWNAPVIVTTMVQLFESLFANSTSACRKLHRLVGSVIVLDEAQTIPPNLRGPITDVLHQLVDRYGASVVLCTATQPELDLLPTGVPIREIAPEPKRLFSILKRVTYEWPALEDAWSWERVAEEMERSDQALTIVNTIGDAHALLDAAAGGALHLSTALCPDHRVATLDEIRRRLEAAAPCRVVSTQVVEAGVDLDFPLVLRALGPLDRIVQAAGRCNREGKLSSGRVIVFRPADGHLPPGSYKTATQATESLLSDGSLDMDDPETFSTYFARLLRLLTNSGQAIQQARLALAYETVAGLFRLIDDDTVNVVVSYRGPGWLDEIARAETRAASDAIINRLRNAQCSPKVDRALLREASPISVAIRRRKLDGYIEQGLASELVGGLYAWHGTYDDTRGLLDHRTDPEGLYLG